MDKRLQSLESTMLAFGFAEEQVSRALDALTQAPAVSPAETESPLLTAEQVCQALSISYTTLWRYNPPYHRVGARKRYVLAEVIRHMSQNGHTVMRCKDGTPTILEGAT